jgi:molybdopterin-guanine dinucleotide biosynthesis protein A
MQTGILHWMRNSFRQAITSKQKKYFRMLGVILCGGQSSRMGSDKGLLKTQSATWAQLAADKITSLALPVVISVNENQFKDYSSLFPASQLLKDNPSLQLKGPLLGVLSVHRQHPTEDLLVLACDMPLMEVNILQELISLYKQETADAYVFANDKEPEPLCAIYTARGLQQIIRLYNNNMLARHSMKFVLDHINSFVQPMTPAQTNHFRNFNAHAQLNGL